MYSLNLDPDFSAASDAFGSALKSLRKKYPQIALSEPKPDGFAIVVDATFSPVKPAGTPVDKTVDGRETRQIQIWVDADAAKRLTSNVNRIATENGLSPRRSFWDRLVSRTKPSITQGD